MSFNGFPKTRAFWQARNTMWGKNLDVSDKRHASPGSGTWYSRVRRKEHLWNTRADKYLSNEQRILSSWRTTVKYDIRLQEDILATVNRINQGVGDIMDDKLATLAFNAWREWPWDTGFSRSLIEINYEIRGDDFVGQVSSMAPYTYFIKGHPHKALISKPGKDVGLAIGRAIMALGRVGGST